jgi:hypothetical protein
MDEDERRVSDQLMVVDALVRAIDRRDEVFQMVEDVATSVRNRPALLAAWKLDSDSTSIHAQGRVAICC